jgi:replication factor A1
MTEVANAASDLVGEFDEHLDLEQDAVEAEVTGLVSEFSLPVDEAKRTVRNKYLDEAGIEDTNGAVPPASGDDSEFDPTPVEEIDADNEWHDLRVEVIQLWDPNSDQMEQVGLIGDKSDVIKFTLWKDTEGIPSLENGNTYHIRNVVTDEYNGRYSVKFTKASSIEVADDDEITDSGGEVTVEGVLVDVKSGSGLIKRCPDDDCTRVIQNGRCAEHGPVEGEFDLRIKAVIDDGYVAQDVVFGEEATTEVTGITLEEAQDHAMDALDTSVVAQEIGAEVIGQYFQVEGPELGRNVVVNDVEAVEGVSEDALQALNAHLSGGVDADADADAGQSEASA